MDRASNRRSLRRIRRAFVGIRGGYQWLRGTDGSALYGLYAPLGVLVAREHCGVLLYPVDVGSYLTATDAESIDYRDAIRGGAAVVIRTKSAIALGLGGDYRPRIGAYTEEWRLFGYLGLELPLFELN